MALGDHGHHGHHVQCHVEPKVKDKGQETVTIQNLKTEVKTALENLQENNLVMLGHVKVRTKYYYNIKQNNVRILCLISVDGAWSTWSTWSFCTKTCSDMEGGLRQRSRSCSNPEPKFGGLDCQGETMQTTTCGQTCQLVYAFHLSGTHNQIFSIGVTSDHIDPKLPESSFWQENPQFVRCNTLSWRNGILFCSIDMSDNCLHWDVNLGIWTDMKNRPPHQHFAAGSLVTDGKWMLAGGGDRLTSDRINTK